MAQYRPPEPINFLEPKWDVWKSSFMTFRLVSELHRKSSEVQVASLKYCMGYESEEVFKTFNLSEEEGKQFDTVLSKFDAYFKPKVNVIRLRRIFQRRLQAENESEEVYIRTLYTLAEDCAFGELKQERIRDQFIAGINDDRLQEKLELQYMSNQEDFTLAKVVEYTRVYCDIRDGRKLDRAANDIHAVKLTQSMDNVCGYCGRVHPRQKCPAFGKKCAKCSRRNHFASVCRNLGNRTYNDKEEARGRYTNNGPQYRPNLNAVESSASSPYEEEGFVAFLGEHKSNPGRSWNVDILVNSIKIPVKIDTGADVSVLNNYTYKKIPGVPALSKPNRILRTPNGVLDIAGIVELSISKKENSKREIFYVLPPENNTVNLLSRNASLCLGFVVFCFEVVFIFEVIFIFEVFFIFICRHGIHHKPSMTI